MINCGTDIVKISRLEKALETPGFYEKVFGKRERAEFEKRGARLESLAAAFSLSLSHDGDYATAFVICVTKGENIL